MNEMRIGWACLHVNSSVQKEIESVHAREREEERSKERRERKREILQLTESETRKRKRIYYRILDRNLEFQALDREHNGNVKH